MLLKIFLLPHLIFKKLYVSWIKKNLKHKGKNIHIQYPIDMRGGEFITIGDNFISNPRLRIDALPYLSEKPQLVIGNNVNINFDCHIGCANNVVIGNNVLIASKVFISDHSHGNTDFVSLKIPPSDRKIISKGPVIIKDNVWIGEGVAILPNVIIGENSIIGANSVVTHSFPPYSIIGGNPAKIIKSYPFPKE